MQRLAHIRRAGYSVTRGELDVDVMGVAAPVRVEQQQAVAAVSIAALASRVFPEAEAELARKVQETAREISERLTAVGG